MASPKQRVQRFRFSYKGFISGARSRVEGFVRGGNISMREKCHLATIVHELDLLIRDCDMESQKQIREAK